MTSHLLRAALVWVLACTVPLAAKAGNKLSLSNAAPASGISLEAEVLYNQVPSSGFYPLHFRIHNRTNGAHTWTVRISSSNNTFGGSNPGSMSWSTELTVGPGQSGQWDLLIPRASLDSLRSGYEMLSGRISGYGIQSEHFSLPSHYSGGINTAFVLISEPLANAVWSKLDAEVKKGTGSAATALGEVSANLMVGRFEHSSRFGGRTLGGSKVDVKDLPPDWRALSGVAGFWLTSRDWQALSADRRRVVRQWIGAGGHLFVANAETPIAKLPLLPPLLEAGKRVQIGLGSVQAVQLTDKELPVAETATAILSLDAVTFPAWSADYRNWSLLQSIGWPTMNVQLIILFVTIFAVVIGPVNLRMLAPPQRRYRLFFTVPLISVAASVTLFGVIALGDGFGGSGYRNALVYLPAGENLATVSQEQISRSRLLFGRGFSIPSEAQFSVVHLAENNKAKLSLERSGNSATGDWFRSRAVQAHAARAIVPTRAEVVLQNPGAAADQKPVLLSSAAGVLRDVVYVDSAGQHWRADQLPTGTPVTLVASSPEQWAGWVERNTKDLSPQLEAAIRSVAGRPGHFYAIGQSLPEAPLATLPGIRWQRETIVCFGTCVKGDAQ